MDLPVKIERVPNNFGYALPKKFTLHTNTHLNRVEALHLNLGVKFQPQLRNVSV
jgi:hypothetical protein